MTYHGTAIQAVRLLGWGAIAVVVDTRDGHGPPPSVFGLRDIVFFAMISAAIALIAAIVMLGY